MRLGPTASCQWPMKWNGRTSSCFVPTSSYIWIAKAKGSMSIIYLKRILHCIYLCAMIPRQGFDLYKNVWRWWLIESDDIGRWSALLTQNGKTLACIQWSHYGVYNSVDINELISGLNELSKLNHFFRIMIIHGAFQTNDVNNSIQENRFC